MSEEVTETEVVKEAKAIKFSWLKLQIIICTVTIIALVMIKEFFPLSYENLTQSYSEIIEKTIMIEDGEISIVQE